jgi:hypothetical protein
LACYLAISKSGFFFISNTGSACLVEVVFESF